MCDCDFNVALVLCRQTLAVIPADIEPNPENRSTYDRLFSEFVKIYKRNKSIYSRLNATGH